MDGIAFDVQFTEQHPDALAVYCSDGRFTLAVESLLSHLGHARLDTLTIPGGAALLHMWSASYSDAESVRGAASFLIDGHKTKHIALIAHSACGYYRKRYPISTREQIRERQLHDLKQAAEWLRSRHKGSGLDVKAFYASVRGPVVEFAPVEV